MNVYVVLEQQDSCTNAVVFATMADAVMYVEGKYLPCTQVNKGVWKNNDTKISIQERRIQ